MTKLYVFSSSKFKPLNSHVCLLPFHPKDNIVCEIGKKKKERKIICWRIKCADVYQRNSREKKDDEKRIIKKIFLRETNKIQICTFQCIQNHFLLSSCAYGSV